MVVAGRRLPPPPYQGACRWKASTVRSVCRPSASHLLSAVNACILQTQGTQTCAGHALKILGSGGPPGRLQHVQQAGVEERPDAMQSFAARLLLIARGCQGVIECLLKRLGSQCSRCYALPIDLQMDSGISV